VTAADRDRSQRRATLQPGRPDGRVVAHQTGYRNATRRQRGTRSTVRGRDDHGAHVVPVATIQASARDVSMVPSGYELGIACSSKITSAGVVEAAPYDAREPPQIGCSRG
jgi:hypothetical protein